MALYFYLIPQPFPSHPYLLLLLLASLSSIFIYTHTHVNNTYRNHQGGGIEDSKGDDQVRALARTTKNINVNVGVDRIQSLSHRS